MYVRTEIQFLAPKINTSCLLVYSTFWMSVAIALWMYDKVSKTRWSYVRRYSNLRSCFGGQLRRSVQETKDRKQGLWLACCHFFHHHCEKTLRVDHVFQKQKDGQFEARKSFFLLFEKAKDNDDNDNDASNTCQLHPKVVGHNTDQPISCVSFSPSSYRCCLGTQGFSGSMEENLGRVSNLCLLAGRFQVLSCNRVETTRVVIHFLFAIPRRRIRMARLVDRRLQDSE